MRRFYESDERIIKIILSCANTNDILVLMTSWKNVDISKAEYTLKCFLLVFHNDILFVIHTLKLAMQYRSLSVPLAPL